MHSFVMVSLVAFLPAAAFAQTPATPVKVGYINFQAALANSRDGKKAAEELTARFDPRQKDLDARKSEIDRLEDQLRKGGNLLSPEKQAQLTRDVDEKKKRFQRDLQDADEELQGEQRRMIESIGQKMIAAIGRYGAEHGYSGIFDVSAPNTPVLYASPADDVTKQITTYYDEQAVHKK